MVQRINFELLTNLGNLADPVELSDAASKNYVDTSTVKTFSGTVSPNTTDPTGSKVGDLYLQTDAATPTKILEIFYKSSNATNPWLVVEDLNVNTLQGLTDVNVVEGPAINNLPLIWDNATSKWVARKDTLANLGDVSLVTSSTTTYRQLFQNDGTSNPVTLFGTSQGSNPPQMIAFINATTAALLTVGTVVTPTNQDSAKGYIIASVTNAGTNVYRINFSNSVFGDSWATPNPTNVDPAPMYIRTTTTATVTDGSVLTYNGTTNLWNARTPVVGANITSPNSTINVGGTAAAPTVDVNIPAETTRIDGEIARQTLTSAVSTGNNVATVTATLNFPTGTPATTTFVIPTSASGGGTGQTNIDNLGPIDKTHLRSYQGIGQWANQWNVQLSSRAALITGDQTEAYVSGDSLVYGGKQVADQSAAVTQQAIRLEYKVAGQWAVNNSNAGMSIQFVKEGSDTEAIENQYPPFVIPFSSVDDFIIDGDPNKTSVPVSYFQYCSLNAAPSITAATVPAVFEDATFGSVFYTILTLSSVTGFNTGGKMSIRNSGSSSWNSSWYIQGIGPGTFNNISVAANQLVMYFVSEDPNGNYSSVIGGDIPGKLAATPGAYAAPSTGSTVVIPWTNCAITTNATGAQVVTAPNITFGSFGWIQRLYPRFFATASATARGTAPFTTPDNTTNWRYTLNFVDELGTTHPSTTVNNDCFIDFQATNYNNQQIITPSGTGAVQDYQGVLAQRATAVIGASHVDVQPGSATTTAAATGTITTLAVANATGGLAVGATLNSPISLRGKVITAATGTSITFASTILPDAGIPAGTLVTSIANQITTIDKDGVTVNGTQALVKSLTTTGSGPATFVNGTLNIPQDGSAVINLADFSTDFWHVITETTTNKPQAFIKGATIGGSGRIVSLNMSGVVSSNLVGKLITFTPGTLPVPYPTTGTDVVLTVSAVETQGTAPNQYSQIDATTPVGVVANSAWTTVFNPISGTNSEAIGQLLYYKDTFSDQAGLDGGTYVPYFNTITQKHHMASSAELRNRGAAAGNSNERSGGVELNYGEFSGINLRSGNSTLGATGTLITENPNATGERVLVMPPNQAAVGQFLGIGSVSTTTPQITSLAWAQPFDSNVRIALNSTDTSTAAQIKAGLQQEIAFATGFSVSTTAFTLPAGAFDSSNGNNFRFPTTGAPTQADFPIGTYIIWLGNSGDGNPARHARITGPLWTAGGFTYFPIDRPGTNGTVGTSLWRGVDAQYLANISASNGQVARWNDISVYLSDPALTTSVTLFGTTYTGKILNYQYKGVNVYRFIPDFVSGSFPFVADSFWWTLTGSTLSNFACSRAYN